MNNVQWFCHRLWLRGFIWNFSNYFTAQTLNLKPCKVTSYCYSPNIDPLGHCNILSAQILTPVILNLQPCRSPLTAVVDSKVKALSDDDLLDTMYPSPEELGQYWAHLLPDFDDHWLRGYPERWCRCIPIVLWGDEGTLNSSSWMVVSWNPSRQ